MRERDPKKAMGFQRIETLSFEQGIKKAKERGKPRVLFLVDNPNCNHCGLEGSFWAVEKDNGGGVHLNLFGKDSEEDDVLLTIDHMTPRSKGGLMVPENLQTLCFPCNQNKSNN